MPEKMMEIEPSTLRRLEDLLASEPGDHMELVQNVGTATFSKQVDFEDGKDIRWELHTPGSREERFLAAAILEDKKGNILSVKRREEPPLDGLWTLSDGEEDYTLNVVSRHKEKTEEADNQAVIHEKAIVDGVSIQVEGINDLTINEAKNYMELIGKNLAEGTRLSELTIHKEGRDNVALDYLVKTQPIERIRRITGYLVGTIDRWNNAKKAEERDRVKHIRADVIR